MTNKKSTKRALLLSALSLLMCVSMLVGSTFAWFTDSVTSAGNKIVAGTLEVDLLMAGANGEYASIAGEDAAIFGEGSLAQNNAADTLWEPGKTQIVYLGVENKGNLDLKYNILLNVIDGGLIGSLEYAIVDGVKASDNLNVDDWAAIKALAQTGDIAAGTTVAAPNGVIKVSEGEDAIEYFALAVHMKEEASNQYQGKDITIDVTVLATQFTSEFDSFDNQYDKMATIDTEAELLEALAADYDLIQLGANIELTDSVVIPADKTVAIDLAGYTMIQAKGDIATAYAMIDNKGTLTIEDSVGTGKISFADTTPYTADIGWASNTIRNQGALIVNGGTIENTTAVEVMSFSYPHAIDCYPGSVATINDGTVKSANYDSIRMFCNSDTLATTVNINGGTIVNRVSFQDPSGSKAGYGILNISNGNFITTDDVKGNVRLLNFSNVGGNMKATVTGGIFDKGFYTQDVVSLGVVTSDWLNYAGGIAVSNEAELQAALDNAADGDIIKFAGNITGNVTATAKANVAVTIDGNGNTLNGSITIDGKSATITSAGLTIKNVNFNAAGIAYDACVRLGDSTTATRYVCNVTVENCTFTGVLAEEKVGVKSYTGGDKNITVTGCTATGMHSLAQLYVTEGVTFADCKVQNSKNGISVRASDNVVISGCNIDATAYGIRADGGACVQTLKNNTITAAKPVIVRKLTTAGYVLNLEGNTLTATSADGYQLVLTTGDDEAAYVAPTVSYTLTGADDLKVFK